MKTTLASFLVLFMSLQMSVAQGLSAGDMAFAFGGDTASGAVRELQRSAPAPQALSAGEMEATVGKFWPIVYQAAVLGTRATMWVASSVARPIFRRAVSGKENNRRLLKNPSFRGS